MATRPTPQSSSLSRQLLIGLAMIAFVYGGFKSFTTAPFWDNLAETVENAD